MADLLTQHATFEENEVARTRRRNGGVGGIKEREREREREKSARVLRRADRGRKGGGARDDGTTRNEYN